MFLASFSSIYGLSIQYTYIHVTEELLAKL